MATYSAKGLTNTTSFIGRSYVSGSPTPIQDSYTRTRYYCRITRSAALGTFYPATGTADGSITRTDIVATGTPPDPAS